MNSNTSCSGCYPVYQHNQMAHMEEGGCLYCPFYSTNDSNGESEIVGLDVVADVGTDTVTDMSSNENINTECCICLEIIDKKKNNCTTECGHSFCLKCLATSLIHNNSSCPYCRSNLVDITDKKHYDEYNVIDDDYSDYSDEDDDDDDDDDEDICDIDEIITRIDKIGFTKKDIISMLVGRYKKDDKYTDEYIYDINNKFDKLIKDSDKECKEQKLFALEDVRITI